MTIPASKIAKYDVKIAMLVFAILVTSSIAGQNFVNVFGHKIATGMLIFPLTFILVASATELYGFQYSRSIIWTAAFCNMLMVLTIVLFTKISFSGSYIGDVNVYHKFCERLAYLMAMSTFAYLISEYANAWILSKLWVLTSGRFLLYRAFFSISIAVTIDTWLFFPIIASRQGSISACLTETFVDMFIKIGYELSALPLFWLLVEYVKNRERKDFEEELPEFSSQFSSVYYLKSESELELIKGGKR